MSTADDNDDVETIFSKDSAEVDDMGRSLHLRARYYAQQDRKRRDESVKSEGSLSARTARSARSSASGGRTRSLEEVQRDFDDEFEVVTSGSLAGETHSNASGTERCSPVASGVQPPAGRSSKESPPIGVPPGSSCEGVGAGRRNRSLSPRTVLRRFGTESGSCCFDAVTRGWRQCAKSAEYDVPVRSLRHDVTTGERSDERVGERFCLAHTPASWSS